ncbi:MAG: hypothetical protein SFU98_08740 [Leptospiraceae bacterium]|nr:hypothetical protein [Leptospiraceae bacterium]
MSSLVFVLGDWGVASQSAICLIVSDGRLVISLLVEELFFITEIYNTVVK